MLQKTPKTSMPLARVLVLEEDAQWREALAGMYRSILGRGGEVATASDSAVAERQLKRQPVDVLSLDLNLSEGRAGTSDVADNGPLLCDTGRLQLIEVAAKRRWAGAVIVITHSGADGQSRFIACDEDKLNEATVSPDEFVRRRFDDRALVLNKPARWDLPTSIARFEELIRRRLPDLARPGYTLQFGGTTYDARVAIKTGRQVVAALEGADAMLLVTLVVAGRAGELVSDRSVLEIYRGRGAASEADAADATRLAQREIDGFRRRLRRHGVNDRALISRVRKSGSGDRAAGLPATGAWRLDGAVASEGMSSLNVRARGGHGFRPEMPAPEE
jgi:hypothetical protein